MKTKYTIFSPYADFKRGSCILNFDFWQTVLLKRREFESYSFEKRRFGFTLTHCGRLSITGLSPVHAPTQRTKIQYCRPRNKRSGTEQWMPIHGRNRQSICESVTRCWTRRVSPWKHGYFFNCAVSGRFLRTEFPTPTLMYNTPICLSDEKRVSRK